MLFLGAVDGDGLTLESRELTTVLIGGRCVHKCNRLRLLLVEVEVESYQIVLLSPKPEGNFGFSLASSRKAFFFLPIHFDSALP